MAKRAYLERKINGESFYLIEYVKGEKKAYIYFNQLIFRHNNTFLKSIFCQELTLFASFWRSYFFPSHFRQTNSN